MKVLRYLQRTTTTGLYLPHLDGLRFLALFLVVVQMHVTHFIDEKFFDNRLFTNPYWRGFIMEGNHGVFLFFSISGFVLGLPFAKSYLQQTAPIHLKKYYLRRLIRLEPPYQLVLLVLLVAQVWVIKKDTLAVLWPHYLASFFYIHNLIYHSFSWIMPVAWTLEVEIQFYIIAPLLFLIYKLPRGWMRLVVYSFIITLSIMYTFWFGKGIGNVFTFLFYFMGGVLLADAYVSRFCLVKNNTVSFGLAIAALVLFLVLKAGSSAGLHLVKYVAMLILFHCVLINDRLQQAFSNRWMVAIGTMCYSIYLLHFAVLSVIGRLLLQTGVALNNTAYIIGYYLLFLAVILILATLYFFLVEKPFMQLKIRYWGLRKAAAVPVSTNISA